MGFFVICAEKIMIIILLSLYIIILIYEIIVNFMFPKKLSIHVFFFKNFHVLTVSWLASFSYV